MRLKVLMLGWEYPPYIQGGLGVATQALAQALARRVDLNLVFPGQDNPREVVALSERGTQTPLAPPNYLISGYERAEKGPYAGDLSRRVDLYTQRVIDRIDSTDFDLIHAHDWMTFSAALELKERTGKPLVLHVHSIDADRSGGTASPNWMQQIEGWGLRQADVVLAVSQHSADQISTRYGVSPERIRVVYHGEPDFRPFRQPRPFPEQLVVFVGRLTWQKGPDLFLEMALRILTALDRVRFFLIGDGDMKPGLVQRVAQARVGDQVHFAGFLEKEELAKVLAMANVCVLPSRAEPFGLAATEAAAFGVPLVISNRAGVREVLPDALYVDPENVDQLAGKVAALLRYPDLAGQLAQKAQTSLEKLSWENAATQIIEIYHQLLTASGS